MIIRTDICIPIDGIRIFKIIEISGGRFVTVGSDIEGSVIKEYFPDVDGDGIRFGDLRELYELIGKILEAENE